MKKTPGSVAAPFVLSPSAGLALKCHLIAAALVCFTPVANSQSHCHPSWTAAYKCSQGCGSCGGGGHARPDRDYEADDEAAAEVRARNVLIDRYNDKLKESNAAASAGRYREAARLRREAVSQRGSLGQDDKTRQALINADNFERHADAEDDLKAGDAAARAGNIALALEHYQRVVREFDNEQNHQLIARLQIRLQAEKEAKVQAERDRLVAGKIHKKVADFAASLDTGAPAPGPLVIHGGTTGDAIGSHKANAPILEFGDPNAAEAPSQQARQGFDSAGRLKGSRPVPEVSIKEIQSRPVSVGALATQIPDQAKSDPVVKQSLAWYNQLDAMKAETDRKTAAVKEQQKSGRGDPAVLAAQLGTFANDSRRIEKDQVKAAATIKKQVKDLGFVWIEGGSVAPQAK